LVALCRVTFAEFGTYFGTVFGIEGSPPRRCPVKALVGQLVDGRTLRASGMVANTKREKGKDRPAISVEPQHEDHSEPAGRGR